MKLTEILLKSNVNEVADLLCKGSGVGTPPVDPNRTPVNIDDFISGARVHESGFTGSELYPDQAESHLADHYDAKKALDSLTNDRTSLLFAIEDHKRKMIKAGLDPDMYHDIDIGTHDLHSISPLFSELDDMYSLSYHLEDMYEPYLNNYYEKASKLLDMGISHKTAEMSHRNREHMVRGDVVSPVTAGLPPNKNEQIVARILDSISRGDRTEFNEKRGSLYSGRKESRRGGHTPPYKTPGTKTIRRIPQETYDDDDVTTM